MTKVIRTSPREHIKNPEFHKEYQITESTFKLCAQSVFKTVRELTQRGEYIISVRNL